MLYEYPDEFIVPITYINASIENKEQKTIREDEHISERDEIVRDINNDEKRGSKPYVKNNKKHKLKRYSRDKENSNDILNDLVEDNLISSNQKEYYLEDSDIYSDIDDEYAKEEINNKK